MELQLAADKLMIPHHFTLKVSLAGKCPEVNPLLSLSPGKK